MKKLISLMLFLVLTLSMCANVFAIDNLEEAKAKYDEYDKKMQEKTALPAAASGFCDIGDFYMNKKMYAEAIDAYDKSYRCYSLYMENGGDDVTWLAEESLKKYYKAFDLFHSSPGLGGFTLSGGSLAIVTAFAGIAVGLVGGYFLFGRKKKKAAVETK